MVGKYKVITLCGSTRFKDAFIETQKRLTLEGNIVISVGLFGHSGDEEVWKSDTKEMLDDMHLRKIDMADEVFVINVGGYIGQSTRIEIEYAEAIGKPVKYLENIGPNFKRRMFIPEEYNQPEQHFDKTAKGKEKASNANPNYSVLASKKHPSYLKQFSEQCAEDLSKKQTSMRINPAVLKETSGKGRCKDDDLEIIYLYKIKEAITAGNGKYLKYEIQFAGIGSLKRITYEVRNKVSNRLFYRICSAVTHGKNRVMHAYVPFDPEMILSELQLEITEAQK